MSTHSRHDEPSESLLAEIDPVCDAFEAEWRTGKRPSVEAYLERVSKPAQRGLLRELLRIDLDYRRQRGEAAQFADYAHLAGVDSDIFASLLAMTTDQASTPSALQGSTDLSLEAPVLLGSTAPEATRPDSVAGLPRRFGEFELQKQLGIGGMGVVYLAYEESADRKVALKLIRLDRLEHLTPEQRHEWLARFRTEGQSAARLRHENIVTVHQVGTVDDTPFYSMAYIEGQDLDKLRLEGPLPNARAAAYIEQVARAVQFAHDHGILHRDLKPLNILVDADDRPYVADFGLAKWTEAVEGPTHSGQVLGSPPYMSPEQATDAASVTALSDVYSLGATLYALLTGRPPFQAASVAETLHQLRAQEPVAPRLLNSAIDRDLEIIVMQCLRKDCTRRYPIAAALADDLQAYRETRPIKARPVGKREKIWLYGRRHPARAAVALTCIIAMMLAGSLIASLAYTEQQQKQLDFQTNAKEEADNRAKTENALRAIAEDNHELAEKYLYLNRTLLARYAWDQDELMRARELLALCPKERRNWEWHYLQPLCDSAILSIKGDYGSLRRGSFTPDGKYLITRWNHLGAEVTNVVKYDAVSGREVKRLVFTNESVGDVSSDGKRLVTSKRDSGYRPDRIFVYDLETRRNLLSIKTSFLPLALSPSGNLLGLVKEDEKLASIIAVETGKELMAFKYSTSAPSLNSLPNMTFSPNADKVVLEDRNGPATVWDTKTGHHLFSLERPSLYVDFSPDGRRLVVRESQYLHFYDACTGKNIRTLPAEGWDRVVFSSDGKFVATPEPRHRVTMYDAESGFVARSFKGNTSRVWDVAFDPQNKRLASFSEDGTIRLWDLNTFSNGVFVATSLPTPDNPVGSAVYSISEDGRMLATTNGSKIALWDVGELRKLKEIESYAPRINQVALCGNNKLLAMGSADGTLKVWDLSRDEEVFARRNLGNTDETQGGVLRVALSRQGKRIAAVVRSERTEGWEPIVQMWDLDTGRELNRFSGAAVAFSPEGSHIAIGGGSAGVWWNRGKDYVPYSRGEGGVRVREIDSGRVVLTLAGPWSGPMVFSGDGSCLAVGGRIWDVRSDRILYELQRQDEQLTSISFSPDGTRIAAVFRNGRVRLWDSGLGQEAMSFTAFAPLSTGGPAYPLDGLICFVEKGRGLVLGGGWGQVLRLDTQEGRWIASDAGTTRGANTVSVDTPRTTEARVPASGKKAEPKLAKSIRTCGRHNGHATCVVYSPEGKRALSGGFDRTVRLWDLEKGAQVRQFVGHTNVVWSVAFSQDGRYALSGSEDKTVRLWEVETGKEACPAMKGHQGVVCSVAFLSDGKQAMSGCWDGTIRVWDLASGKQVGSPILIGGPVGITLAGDGRHAFFGSKDRILRYWDILERKVVRAFPGPEGLIEGQALTLDGHQAIVGARDSAIHIYDIEAEKEVKAVMGHDAAVLSVALTPDGSRILSSGEDKTIRLWDMASRRELWRGQCAAEVRSVAFSPDGKRAVSACFDGTVALWELPQ
jgi:WD40 repeat protein/serine/threonine protein kinase